ncbi:MAG: hypothetical protein LBL83_09135, partial [Clostridiales bacterium]|nr:hypothetical protein [Clostridiales bacterium]
APAIGSAGGASAAPEYGAARGQGAETAEAAETSGAPAQPDLPARQAGGAAGGVAGAEPESALGSESGLEPEPEPKPEPSGKTYELSFSDLAANAAAAEKTIREIVRSHSGSTMSARRKSPESVAWTISAGSGAAAKIVEEILAAFAEKSVSMSAGAAQAGQGGDIRLTLTLAILSPAGGA